MKITAIDADTGKILMTQAGSLNEDNFKKTVLDNFPTANPEKLIIVVDGKIRSNSGPTRQVRAKGGKSVIWRGSFTDLGGYANMNREIALRLQHHGFQVKAEVLKTGLQIDPMTHSIIRVLESVHLPDERDCPLVIGFTPMQVRSAKRRVIFYTMMETQSLHPEFVNRCNSSATEIWVPGEFYANVFKECGIVRPIRVMPLGVNEHIYKPEAKAPTLVYEEMPDGKRTTELPDTTRFMSVFGWSYRKGPDILCRSFLEEFGEYEASLVIYSRYMGSSAEQHKEHVRKEIRGYYKDCGKESPPHVYYCGDPVPISEFPGCYASADAFVLCSRGEGFGLPAVEAGACGTPVISSYNTAMTDYLDEDVAYCVEPDGYASANERLCWISGYYRDQQFAILGEESVQKFRRAMRRVAEHPDEAADKAENFRDRILDNYTWDICATRVAQRLGSEHT